MDNVWVFFYGTFMSADVLRRHGMVCDETIPVKLDGYELSIRPRVNLIPKTGCTSYGGLAHVSHGELSTLYGGLVANFGISYLPYPVKALMANGRSKLALCYISFDIEESLADPEYVHEMAKCAAELGAPEAYREHIKSFLES